MGGVLQGVGGVLQGRWHWSVLQGRWGECNERVGRGGVCSRGALR